MKIYLIAFLLMAAPAFAWTRTDTLKVTSDANDARVIGSTLATTGTIYNGKFDDGSYCSSIHRMQSLIPAGQTITSAIFEVRAYGITGTDTSYVMFEDANSPTMPSSGSDFNSRVVTDSVQWIGGGTWTEGTRYQKTITTPFSTLYAAAKCDSGEYVNVFWKGRNAANANHYRTILGYDNSPTYVAYLIVTHETAVAVSDTYRVCYIVPQADTNSHNSAVDSLRYDIVNDPQGQLPGTWQVDLLSKDSAESRSAAFWNNYNVIMTWGAYEAANLYYLSVDGILDTIHKPVICQDAALALHDPMWLGSTKIASLNTTNAPSHFRVNNNSHFITKYLYTDEYNSGDSIALYANGSSPNTDGLTGMAHEVQTLLRMARDTDAGTDSAVLVICEAGDTNANNTVAPDKRAFISINSSWRYCSWNARDVMYRTLRWAVGDTGPDTCQTQVRIACEAVDGKWIEYSTSTCSNAWAYDGDDALKTGHQIEDRVTLIRARSTAIATQLPDTTASWSYDVTNVKLICRIGNIVEDVPSASFSFWEAIFEPKTSTLWRDGKRQVQLDSTCGSWVSTQTHTGMSNRLILSYPSVLWDSPGGSTRGTDYESSPLDSIFIQDPVTDNYFTWNIPVDTFLDWASDSAGNNGIMTHTGNGTITNEAEIHLISESNGAASSGRRNSPQFLATLVWRAANTGAADLDSSILIQDTFGNDSMEFNVFVNGDLPTTQTFVISNGSSSASFDCATTEESPAVDWATVTTIGGGTTTYYAIIGVDQTGLAVGYYYTWIKATCSGVPDSPDSAKVILNVESTATRSASGTIKIQ